MGFLYFKQKQDLLEYVIKLQQLSFDIHSVSLEIQNIDQEGADALYYNDSNIIVMDSEGLENASLTDTIGLLTHEMVHAYQDHMLETEQEFLSNHPEFTNDFHITQAASNIYPEFGTLGYYLHPHESIAYNIFDQAAEGFDQVVFEGWIENLESHLQNQINSQE